MGTRAFSHDSIFIPDGGAESEQTVQAMSQDNILGKVKTLQVRRSEGQRHRKGVGGWPRREVGKVSGLALSHGLGSPGVTPGENVCFLKPGLVLWKLLCTHERYIVKWYPPSEHPLSFSLKLLPHF